jgi:hypothetical protein
MQNILHKLEERIHINYSYIQAATKYSLKKKIYIEKSHLSSSTGKLYRNYSCHEIRRGRSSGIFQEADF